MSATAHQLSHPTCWHLKITGQVQGVGFRPFVYRLATESRLGGFVRNDGSGVEIAIQGDIERLERFLARLRAETPPLARIDDIAVATVATTEPRGDFIIETSRADAVHTAVAPDVGVCDACLAELFAPTDRRYRYPFINCTHCGPRYTLTAALPYDRRNTSMAKFNLCAPCAAEYTSPLSRRFHAQPNACADCGPSLTLCDHNGDPETCADPVTEALARLQGGQILAIKGLGGFHLACDALNAEAVARLRANKHRDQKPFAVMVANIASLCDVAEVNLEAQRLLESKERPIVLTGKRPACDTLLPGIAPGMPCIGVMLPYTPVHYLLFHEAAGRPSGLEWLNETQSLMLVVTSANPNGEPLAIANDEALRRLRGVVDGYLVHDRDILVHCDDSVIRGDTRPPIPVRRARGFTPQAIRLSRPAPHLLACGAWYKNTVCVSRDGEAFLSQHIGDLDNRATCRLLRDTVAHLLSVLEIEPQLVVHDLHPDFFSTTFAASFAAERGLQTLGVQHHHAHAAAVMAEHGIAGPVLALTLDGIGLGDDGGLWGGELLQVDGAQCQRLGHLRPLALPGGDRAAREPWRMAASALHALGRHDEIAERFGDQTASAVVGEMLRHDIHCPPTSSAGRWFDAAAGLLGICPKSSFEAEAAMHLEQSALRHGPVASLDDGFRIERKQHLQVLDLLTLLDTLAETRDPAFGASLFHATLISALTEWIVGAARDLGHRDVVLAGGCFLNRLLGDGLARSLGGKGFAVHRARRLPPNDGGISLGQVWVAMHSQEMF